MKNGIVPRVWSILLYLVNPYGLCRKFPFWWTAKISFFSTELEDPKPSGLAQESFWHKVAY